jgi:hypothetical protein
MLSACVVGLGPVAQFGYAFGLSAMRATEDGAFFFHPVTEDMDTAVRTGGRNALNGAFEAIERVRHPVDHHLKCLVVIVSAGFTLGHSASRQLVYQT